MSIRFFLLGILFTAQPGGSKLLAQARDHLTLVYDITINKNKTGGGIEETYNGGTRTVFISQNKARIRLVSLMRIQSIFFDFNQMQPKHITMVKESGPEKYLYHISPAQWQQINRKYTGVSCKLLTDSMNVGGYRCRKAIISLVSGRQITAYYTSSFTTAAKQLLIEPLFSCIPGTVLQYEVASATGSVIFKISEVNRQQIAAEVLMVPDKNMQVKNWETKDADGNF